VEVYPYSIVIKNSIYFILEQRNCSLHQFQAVFTENFLEKEYVECRETDRERQTK
jgi:hypothetical protein